MEFLTFGERLWSLIAPFHYRISRYTYGLAMVFGIFIASAGAAVIGLPVVAISIIGVVRWQIDRAKSRSGLIVARFSGPSDVAEETQRIILASLARELAADEAKLVHRVPAVIGPDDRRFAAVLRRRLGASFLLHGRVTTERSVFATVMQPIREGIFHIDFHTWDTSVMKAPWRSLFNDLSPEHYVHDEAYPYEFTHELEGVVRGSAGQLALANNDFQRARRLLEDALSVAPSSASHQIDLLRVDLAKALISEDKLEQAIRMLRERAAANNPSPDLMRQLAASLFLIYGMPDGPPARIRRKAQAEAVAALRLAAQVRSDPRLQLTEANLVLALEASSPSARTEREQIVEDLLASKGPYSKAWYLFRALGADAWHAADAAKQSGDQKTLRLEATRAAHWYSLAIKSRPRFKLLIPSEQGLELKWMPLPRSPVLYANFYDALWFAGQQAKATKMERRARKLRVREFRKGLRHMARQRWTEAHWSFNRACVGWIQIPPELEARLMSSIAMKQIGNDQVATEMWQQASSIDPTKAMEARQRASKIPLPRGLP
jgi:hypothetical protein